MPKDTHLEGDGIHQRGSETVPGHFACPGQRRGGECIVTPALWELALPCQPLPRDIKWWGMVSWSRGGSWPWIRNGRARGKQLAEGRGETTRAAAFLNSTPLLPGKQTAHSAQYHTGTAPSRCSQKLALLTGPAQPAARTTEVETFGLGALGSPSLNSMAVTQLILTEPYGVGTITIPILQTRTLRPRENDMSWNLKLARWRACLPSRHPVKPSSLGGVLTHSW